MNLQGDPATKKWRVVSKRMFAPEFQRATYEDIAAIFKSKPELYVVHEERTSDGKFKSFSVDTRPSETPR